MATNGTSTNTEPPTSWTAQYGWLIAVLMVTMASILANIGMNVQVLQSPFELTTSCCIYIHSS